MAFLQLLVVVVFITLSLDKGVTLTLDDCPDIPGTSKWDPYNKVFGDFCYRFHLWKNRDYPGAQAECAYEGGTLVMIKSESIQNFIVNKLKNFRFVDSIWMGLQDRGTEGAYTWEDGTRLGSGDYSNWGRWEGPGHWIGTIGENEDCVFLSPTDGEWKDGSCAWAFMTSLVHEDRSFVCQFKIVPTTTGRTTTEQDTTQSTTTQITTKSPVTNDPSTTRAPKTTAKSTTPAPTQAPTTKAPSTTQPTTQAQTTTTSSTTPAPTQAPQTKAPSTTPAPTQAPGTTQAPTQAPSTTPAPTQVPTTQPIAPTSTRLTTSGPIIDCGSFSCSLDCGMDGYQKNATTECPICACNT